MKVDFNKLESVASALTQSGKYEDALRVYFFMADGDPSLDGGYLGEKIGQCYEKMGSLHTAKYWYGRAVEENPAARPESQEARKRLETIVKIDDLLS